LPPAKFVFDEAERRGLAIDSLVSGGCVISGASVRRSVLFSDVRVNCFSQVEDSVILPRVTIGENVVLKRVIVDKGCTLPNGLQVGADPEQDRARFYVSEKGITVITADMLGQRLHGM